MSELDNPEKLKSAIAYQLFQSDSYLLGPYGSLKKEASEKCEVPARLASGHRIQFNYEKLRAMGLLDAAVQFKGLVFHLALLHMERMQRLSGGLSHLKPYAHMAAELATWHKLDRGVWKVSDKFPKPKDFGFADNLSMEEYFKLLLQKNPPKPQGGQPQPQQGQGKGQKQKGGGKGQSKEGEGQEQGQASFNEQAEAMGSKKEYYEQDAGQWSNVSSVEQEAMREQVLAKIEQALKARGTDADNLKRLYDDIMGAKKEKWYEHLTKIIGTRMASSSRWRMTCMRISRKFGWGFPGRRKESRGGLAVAWDVSGSVSNTELGIFVAKSKQIAKAYEAPFFLIVCDAKIQSVHTIRSLRDLKAIEVTGGGGTSSLPVFDLLKKPEYQTDCLVYLTDLEIDFPSEIPKYEVIWGVIGQTDTTMRAPFGKTYHLKVED
jgi:chorismate mutase